MTALKTIKIEIEPMDGEEVMAVLAKLVNTNTYYADFSALSGSDGIEFTLSGTDDDPVGKLEINVALESIKVFAKDGCCDDSAFVSLEIGNDKHEHWIPSGNAGFEFLINDNGTVTLNDIVALDAETTSFIPTPVVAEDVVL